MLSIIGFTITLVTYLFARDILIVFGVLNGLGLCMIFTGLFQEKMKFFNPPIFAALSLTLFITTYGISNAHLFFGLLSLPNSLYEANLFALGFPSASFHSTDYFGFLPWIFIYLFGFFVGMHLKEKNFYNRYGKPNFLAKIGQHSLLIYLLHQPILFAITQIIY